MSIHGECGVMANALRCDRRYGGSIPLIHTKKERNGFMLFNISRTSDYEGVEKEVKVRIRRIKKLLKIMEKEDVGEIVIGLRPTKNGNQAYIELYDDYRE